MIKVTPLFLGHLHAVVANAKYAARKSPEWLRAIDKAYDLLKDEGLLDYNAKTQIWRYQNEQGRVYEVCEGFCGCPATVQHCKHRAARKLIQRTIESMKTQSAMEMAEIV